MSQKLNRVGEIGINNQGMEMKIVGYRNNKDLDILFENNELQKHRQYSVFKSGEIKSNLFPSVYNKGYMGIGDYKCRINGKLTEEYKKWQTLMHRIYDERYLNNNISYRQCSICEEWHDFQNFAQWYENNKWTNELDLELDKDILVKGNKIYSKNTCVLVDTKLNHLFITNKYKRGDLPIGVHFDKERNKYVSYCNIGTSKTKFLGRYETKEECFNTYKKFKEKLIKDIAKEYKEKYPNFPKKLYNVMMNYIVDIND